MAIELQIEYVTGADVESNFTAPARKGQTFTTTDAFTLSAIYFPIHYNNTTAATVVVEVYATAGGLPTGEALSTGSFTKTTAYGAFAPLAGEYWQHCTMSPVTLDATTQYAIVIYAAANQIVLPVDWTSPAYGGGTFLTTDDGSSWSTVAWDLIFQVYGDAGGGIPVQALILLHNVMLGQI